ncbi:ABC transporter substrate-binding protein [Phytoactinopolyspora alkaliphila]|uniref:ABC transporter substrate-binding protein n=1 Tax=Phytoactinopolyspora alkaliphila TaxID=1783498 RepID=A0A6N9YNI5_9ACTN|nr:ABC transporter substrate-binding protein [Phytoactinopolyspora alkaliphila]NED96631.1 ABC transporter substrate-binding protein [Phytoactinopolyspora alkaliphila]
MSDRLLLPSRTGLAVPSSLNRRRFLGLGAAGAAAVALSACSGPSTSSDDAGTTDETSADDFAGVSPASEITFWSVHPGNSREADEELIRRFEEANPDISVTLVTAGANYEEVAQRFQTALQGDERPDVLMLSDVWWFKYFLNGTITPLDALLEAEGVELEDYHDTLIGDYTYDGRQWGMPYARSTPLFYYNKEHWAAAGLPDRGPETWDEFDEWAPALQANLDSGQSVFHHVKGASYVAWIFQSIIWAHGGRYSDDEFNITLDSAEAIGAGDYVRAQVHDLGYAGVTPDDNIIDLSSGGISATIGSTGSLSGLLESASFEVGASFLPAKDEFGCPTGGAGLSIPSGITPERQLAAMRFIKFVTEPENTAYYSQSVGYMPVRKSAVSLMEEAYNREPQRRVALEQLELTSPQDAARVYIPDGDQILGRGLERIMLQNEAAADVWPVVADELATSYEENVEPVIG